MFGYCALKSVHVQYKNRKNDFAFNIRLINTLSDNKVNNEACVCLLVIVFVNIYDLEREVIASFTSQSLSQPIVVMLFICSMYFGIFRNFPVCLVRLKSIAELKRCVVG